MTLQERIARAIDRQAFRIPKRDNPVAQKLRFIARRRAMTLAARILVLVERDRLGPVRPVNDPEFER